MRRVPTARSSYPVVDIKKYGGKQIAFIGKRIIASGRTTQSVLKSAKSKVPRSAWPKITLFCVPKSFYVVYRT